MFAYFTLGADLLHGAICSSHHLWVPAEAQKTHVRPELCNLLLAEPKLPAK